MEVRAVMVSSSRSNVGEDARGECLVEDPVLEDVEQLEVRGVGLGLHPEQPGEGPTCLRCQRHGGAPCAVRAAQPEHVTFAAPATGHSSPPRTRDLSHAGRAQRPNPAEYRRSDPPD